MKRNYALITAIPKLVSAKYIFMCDSNYSKGSVILRKKKLFQMLLFDRLFTNYKRSW